MIVKILKVSRPHYWYKSRIGEFLEVRIGIRITDERYSNTSDEQYYIYDKREDGTERYINYNDCVDCTRYQKIKKLKDKII